MENDIYTAALSTNSSNVATIKGKKYMMNTSTLKTTSWKVIEVNSYDQLNKYFQQTRNTAFVMALLCALAAVFVLIPFAGSFLNPLFHVVNQMKQVQNDDLTVQVPVKSHDEIGYLSESFNTLVDRI